MLGMVSGTCLPAEPSNAPSLRAVEDYFLPERRRLAERTIFTAMIV